MNTVRPSIEIVAAVGGWPAPWPSIDERTNTAHRFVRGTSTVDLVAGDPEDQVDVMIADHPGAWYSYGVTWGWNGSGYNAFFTFKSPNQNS